MTYVSEHTIKVVPVADGFIALDCTCGFTGPAVEAYMIGEELWNRHVDPETRAAWEHDGDA